MLHRKPLDKNFPIQRQLEIDVTPVVLVNAFTLDAVDEGVFLKDWKDDAGFMKHQPGFISTQLHRSIGEITTYLNYAVWESTEVLHATFSHSQFIAKFSAYPSSAVARPHLFQKAGVAGICTP